MRRRDIVAAIATAPGEDERAVWLALHQLAKEQLLSEAIAFPPDMSAAKSRRPEIGGRQIGNSFRFEGRRSPPLPSRCAEHAHEDATARQKMVRGRPRRGRRCDDRQPRAERPPAGKNGARGRTRGPPRSSPALLRQGATDARPPRVSAQPNTLTGPRIGVSAHVRDSAAESSDLRRIGPALPDPATAQQSAVPFGNPAEPTQWVRWGALRMRKSPCRYWPCIKPNGPSGFGYGSTAEDVTAGLSLDGRRIF